MKRSDKTKIEKRLAPFWLYFKLITALGLIVSLIVLYLHSSQWLLIVPIAYLFGLLLLLSRTKLEGWPLVLLSFVRYVIIFFTFTYGAFVILDVKQGVGIREALTAPYRLSLLVFEPTMPFSGILVGIVILLFFLFAYRKRK
ncbi:TPA: hypothetical protein ACPQXA_001508 [Streptococcus mutans]|jgi:hypothetical protein|uniref:Uncharacterized protein n=2 Tax=Streptococcus mutans TaxID=1309 RepID=A0AAX1K153_STRMG|nr:hypothetical protein [Streptococcus mutans]RKV79609.1 MAG: hypothetical protein D8H99_49350 [Streptococcus sp.]EMB56870.1 hypothetical protein SMU88_03857 [Streptococcus mutans NLML8]EMB65345.1 hypothetical protein SMU22_03536 [Streptococcus mutans 4SM1]EMB76807.1 hypothetical protein SMU41_01320 [Streptococcus mutans 2VS1]EMB94022.1 hypothetical protein SMU61_06891 [Streptococcus mutans G123]